MEENKKEKESTQGQRQPHNWLARIWTRLNLVWVMVTKLICFFFPSAPAAQEMQQFME